MKVWHPFEARIFPMEWGTKVFTVLPIPTDLVEKAGLKHGARVEIEIKDHVFNLAVTSAPVIDQLFLYTGKKLMAEAGVAPRDNLDLRLREVDPNYVEVPSDVQISLLQNGVTDQWDALSAGKKRTLLQPVLNAKRPGTRAKKRAALIAMISES